MAYEIDIMGAIGGSTTIDYLLWGLVGIMAIGTVAAIFWFLKYILSFRIRVEISTGTSGPDLITKDLAREIKTDEGTRWQLMKLKGTNKKPLRILPPDARYIDILKDGKAFCRFFKHNETLIPIHPKVKDPTKDDLRKSTVNPEMRAALIDDIHAGEEKFKTNNFWTLAEKAMPIISVIILTVLLVIAMNEFYGGQEEISKMSKETAKLLNEGIKEYTEARQADIIYAKTSEYPIEVNPPE